MAQREIVLETYIVEEAQEAGWVVRKMRYIGRRSCPDRWFFRAGVLVIIEFKKKGEEPDPLQKREHKRLLAAGFKVHVVDTYKHARQLLKLGRYA